MKNEPSLDEQLEMASAAEEWNSVARERAFALWEDVTGVVLTDEQIDSNEPDDPEDHEPQEGGVLGENGLPPLYSECPGYEEFLEEAEYLRENCPNQFWGWMYRGWAFFDDGDFDHDDFYRDGSPECNAWHGGH